jgi:hypothetical protein
MRHLVYSEEGFSVEWSLGFTDSRLLNAPAQLNLEVAGYALENPVRRGEEPTPSV